MLIQIQAMTGSTLQVGVAVALDGVGMFIGLMLGGVLADRYDRRKLILFARGTCGLGFVALSLNAFARRRRCGRSTCWRPGTGSSGRWA